MNRRIFLSTAVAGAACLILPFRAARAAAGLIDDISSQTASSARWGNASLITAPVAVPSLNMEITKDAPETASAMLAFGAAPSPAKASAFAGLRFQACTGYPAARRLRDMGAPIRPVPNTAITGLVMAPSLAFSDLMWDRLA